MFSPLVIAALESSGQQGAETNARFPQRMKAVVSFRGGVKAVLMGGSEGEAEELAQLTKAINNSINCNITP